MTFLQTEYGKPFTPSGFGYWPRDRCDEAGLQGYSAHGLRRALQALGADAGLSAGELMATTGDESSMEASRRTKKQDGDLLAASDMAKGVQVGNRLVPPLRGGAKKWDNHWRRDCVTSATL